jgi:hypothetical protein
MKSTNKNQMYHLKLVDLASPKKAIHKKDSKVVSFLSASKPNNNNFTPPTAA